MRDFAEWNLDLQETKEKHFEQIKTEAKYLVEFAKKGYIADMNVDYVFEEGNKK